MQNRRMIGRDVRRNQFHAKVAAVQKGNPGAAAASPVGEALRRATCSTFRVKSSAIGTASRNHSVMSPRIKAAFAFSARATRLVTASARGCSASAGESGSASATRAARCVGRSASCAAPPPPCRRQISHGGAVRRLAPDADRRPRPGARPAVGAGTGAPRRSPKGRLLPRSRRRPGRLCDRGGRPPLVLHAKHDRRVPVALDSDNHILIGREAASAEFVAHIRDFLAESV